MEFLLFFLLCLWSISVLIYIAIFLASTIQGLLVSWMQIVLHPNLLVFCVYAIDSRMSAMNNGWGIPESYLHILAGFSGAIGALCAIFLLGHRNRQYTFLIWFILWLHLNHIIYNKISWNAMLYWKNLLQKFPIIAEDFQTFITRIKQKLSRTD